MESTNADSDHSMTWEDFFGSTTDLTPTLIGIYDSLLEPDKCLKSEKAPSETAKDARNDPPVNQQQETMIGHKKDDSKQTDMPPEEPTRSEAALSLAKNSKRIAGSVKLPIATLNKSSLYSMRTTSVNNGASDIKSDLPSNATSNLYKSKIQRTFVNKSGVSETKGFDNLSPNVKRMISSAGEAPTLKFQKKTGNVVRSSTRRTNIPLVGATSKISQSGVDILPTVDIYDQPCGTKTTEKTKSEEESPTKSKPIKPEFRIDAEITYDVPTNNRSIIYDVPNSNKTAYESLSLPYIDQSIELSIISNDREFDTKLPSKDNSPQKPDVSPAKVPKVNQAPKSMNRRFTIDSPTKLPKPVTVTILEAGSVGNLKAQKEVSRLNPPSVEVTRPLSMSSIASSSSTSSSGVQNKGGVNSAYLASIESLDDHSDADIASAAGSNNFVNNAGIVNMKKTEDLHVKDFPRQHASDEMAGLSQLERVCAEIVQTENVYVEDLRQVVEGYLHEWRRQATFSEEELAELFNNIEDIYNFNRSLCEELNTCRLDATCIARCFVSNTAGFSIYTSYCTGYPRTMERLAALASDSNSARQFRERQLALGHPLPLASYLLKPVQRILKYHLLLQNVVKQCASSETEYALLKMTGIAQHIDDMKRKHEHAVRVQEIQSLLYGWSGPDLTTYGELCAEGTFRVFGAKAMRHAFLFDRLLLVTKNREDGILAYKSHIMCNNMMLVESIAGAPLSFQVIPWDAPRSQITLQARSLRHKREWTLLLKRVILENYNAVIPLHARQLVMELGQNKTDDDILAEKSHNLITQASMRKQMSAPEYLEKRKVERERRKSFENGIRGRFKKNRKYTVPNSRTESNQDCDCAQISADKGTDYTCDNCYIDLCSDCEAELSGKTKEDKCGCRSEDNDGNKCPECEQSLRYIDAGSVEHLERKHTDCKCSDFLSSQESFGKEFNSLNKTRGYHSSDNIVGYTDNEDKEANISMTNVRSIPKTCLKCSKIKENIVVTDSLGTLARKSRCIDDKHRSDALRSKSKDDPQRSRFSNKIGTWRRKSEPGLQQNSNIITSRKSNESDSDRTELGNEKIEFECRHCGSNKITRRVKVLEGVIVSDQEFEKSKGTQSSFEVKMYNTKNIPKKISKMKKNRAKGLRSSPDMKSKFYADFSTDLSTENILHISESNDSLNECKLQNSINNGELFQTISKDDDIDEETYKKLIEKTDSFKKNELEKVKYLNKQKVINEGSEAEEKCEPSEDIQESCDETEQPLEQIISQLLMQNREFQKLIKKQQLKGNVQRRHQRLLKSHSTPEPDVALKQNDSKIKFKCERQMSEYQPNIDTSHEDIQLLQNDADNATDDEHIYETLRVEAKENKPGPASSKNVSVPNTLSSAQINRPRSFKGHAYDDYVYLSFDQINNIQDEGVYDVPIKSPPRTDKNTKASDYYVTMDNNGSSGTVKNDLYDDLSDVCKRKKEPSKHVGDYLPMSPDQQNPNNPEIWLSRQKEHFNVSRDRKSGSLPRSFQVPTPTSPEDGLTTFKPHSNNNKTYLNREGKVMSIDRPFTIASDQSELSYDDVENYMNEGDMIKFSKQSSNDTTDSIQDISQSTLELEEEIDRCYKNNFQATLDTNKNESLLPVSQADLDISNTSSCEVLSLPNTENKNIDVIHPEHKIYKNTNNLLSLKNVLSRFKNRGPNKSQDEEVNDNYQSIADNSKSDLKSPTSEKRSGLNPRSYSRNLLQRFRSIIGDEHSDDNQNKSNQMKMAKEAEDIQKDMVKSDIKVVITSSDVNLTTSVASSNNDLLSKSVFEPRIFSESQNEKKYLETLSHSCDNIQKTDFNRPSYEKSVSLVTNLSNSSVTSSIKSTSSSNQNLKKLPIYMQGSKNLGARIALSDYVDPTTLINDKLSIKSVNVLINKNALRPDSLFSNSSFVTSSSESTYIENQNRSTSDVQQKEQGKSLVTKSLAAVNADESFYEKSFEKIEHVVDEDVFRDSAVYSDQEDSEDKDSLKNSDGNKANGLKNRAASSSVKRNSSIKSQISISSSLYRNPSMQTRITSKFQVQLTENRISQTSSHDAEKPKTAPPVPLKPKITNIPLTNIQPRTTTQRHETTIKKTDQNESSTKTTKRNISLTNKVTPLEKEKKEKTFIRSNSKELKDEPELKNSKEDQDSASISSKPLGSIQLKRMSFERASLDSATRRLTKLSVNENNKRSSIDPPKTAKSVLERRMEIELMAKSHLNKPTNIARKPIPNVKPKSITTKVATFEKDNESNKESSCKEINATNLMTSDTANIPAENEQLRAETNEDEVKSSWVKQVVNKFQ